MASLYRSTGRLKESEETCREVLSAYRELATLNPSAYLPDVASMLNNMAILYRDIQRPEEAAKTSSEAEEILMPLWQGNPELYGDRMAQILYVRALLDGGAANSTGQASALARRALSAAHDPGVKLMIQRFIDHLSSAPHPYPTKPTKGWR
jgi:hypothetical protein